MGGAFFTPRGTTSGWRGNQTQQMMTAGGEQRGELEGEPAGKRVLRLEERDKFGVLDDDGLDPGQGQGAGAPLFAGEHRHFPEEFARLDQGQGDVAAFIASFEDAHFALGDEVAAPGFGSLAKDEGAGVVGDKF